MFIFWCVLQNGKHNSVTADNIYEAKRRARTLNARQLFVKNIAAGQSSQVAF